MLVELHIVDVSHPGPIIVFHASDRLYHWLVLIRRGHQCDTNPPLMSLASQQKR